MAIKMVQDMQQSPIDYVGSYSEEQLDMTGLSSALDDAKESNQDQFERLEKNLENISNLSDEMMNETFHNNRQRQTYELLRGSNNITEDDIWDFDPTNPYGHMELKRRYGKVMQSQEYQDIQREKLMVDSFIEDYLKDPEKYGVLGEDFIGTINDYMEDSSFEDPTYGYDIEPNEFIAVKDLEDQVDDMIEAIDAESFINVNTQGNSTYLTELEQLNSETIETSVADRLTTPTSKAEERTLLKKGYIEKDPETGTIRLADKGRQYARKKGEDYKINKETYKAQLSKDESGSSSSGGSGKGLSGSPRDQIYASKTDGGKKIKAFDNTLLTYGVSNEVLDDNFDLVVEWQKQNPGGLGPSIFLSMHPELSNNEVNKAVMSTMFDQEGIQLEGGGEFNQKLEEGYELVMGSTYGLHRTPYLEKDGETILIQDRSGRPLQKQEFFGQRKLHQETAEMLGLAEPYMTTTERSARTPLSGVYMEGNDGSVQTMLSYRHQTPVTITQTHLQRGGHAPKNKVTTMDPYTGEMSETSGTVNVGIDYVTETHNGVYSPAFSGKVVSVNNNEKDGGGYGNYVVVKGDETITINGKEYDVYAQYSHNSRNLVGEGDYVSETTNMAQMGGTGGNYRDHVDYSTFIVEKGKPMPGKGHENRVYVDPMKISQFNGSENTVVKTLGDYIGGAESNNDYNNYYRRDRDTRIAKLGEGKKLTDMSIKEVFDFQKDLLKTSEAARNVTKSSPVGKYQIVHSTLTELVNKMEGIDENTIFTPQVQDRMFKKLLLDNSKGKEYLKGDIDTDDFYDYLVNTWEAVGKKNKAEVIKKLYDLREAYQDNTGSRGYRQPFTPAVDQPSSTGGNTTTPTSPRRSTRSNNDGKSVSPFK